MGYQNPQYTDTAPTSILRPDVLSKILMKNPDVATLTAVLMMTKKNNLTVKNPTHTYFEEDNLGRFTTCPLPTAAAALGFDVAGGEGWKVQVGTVIRVPRTGETMVVSAITTDSITVTRSWGATAAADLLANEPLQIIGTAQTEGYSVPVGGSSSPVEKTARVQIFSNPFGVTNTMLSTEIYDDMNSYDGKKRKAFIQHMSDQDTTALWGEINSTGTGATLRKTSTSLNETITSNVTDFQGLLMAELAFQNALLPIFEVGSQHKILVCSAYVANVVSNYSTMKLQTNNGETKYGNAIRSYVFGSGELTIVVARKSLSGPNSRTSFVVDADNCKRIVLGGNGKSRETQYREFSSESTKSDQISGEWFAEAGFYFPQEDSHAKLMNIG